VASAGVDLEEEVVEVVGAVDLMEEATMKVDLNEEFTVKESHLKSYEVISPL